MTPPLDIFRDEPDGSVVWPGTVSDLETAKVKVNEMAAAKLGNNFVFIRRPATNLASRLTVLTVFESAR